MFSSKRGDVLYVMDHLLTVGTFFWWFTIISGGDAVNTSLACGFTGCSAIDQFSAAVHLGPQQLVGGLLVIGTGMICKLMSHTYRIGPIGD